MILPRRAGRTIRPAAQRSTCPARCAGGLLALPEPPARTGRDIPRVWLCEALFYQAEEVKVPVHHRVNIIASSL